MFCENGSVSQGERVNALASDGKYLWQLMKNDWMFGV